MCIAGILCTIARTMCIAGGMICVLLLERYVYSCWNDMCTVDGTI